MGAGYAGQGQEHSGHQGQSCVDLLTHTEFGLLLASIPEPYKVFTLFLVMTGTRFGEATAIMVGDLDMVSVPALTDQEGLAMAQGQSLLRRADENSEWAMNSFTAAGFGG